MAKKSKNLTTIQAITHLLDVIQDFNQLITKHHAIGDEFAVKQYEHLKKNLTTDLIKMLESEYQIRIPVQVAA
jgi:hypothetical protein